MNAEIFSFPERKQQSPKRTAPVVMPTSRILDAVKYYILVTGERDKSNAILNYLISTELGLDTLVTPAVADLIDAVNRKQLFIVEMGGEIDDG